ncbi:hypothetical protein ACTFIU_001997 [Dictyostelium citrinum]
MVNTFDKTFEKRLINAFMRKGNYIKAERIYFTVLNRLTTLGIQNPYKFLRETLIKMTPIMGVSKGDLLINNIVDEFLKASKDQGEVLKEKWALYKEVRYALSFNKAKKKKVSFIERLIAIRARGGALKRKYRYIEHYKQKWMDKWLFVMRIEYDPNRSAHIALCSILKEGIYFYVISVAKLEVGSLIITSNLKQGILQKTKENNISRETAQKKIYHKGKFRITDITGVSLRGEIIKQIIKPTIHAVFDVAVEEMDHDVDDIEILFITREEEEERRREDPDLYRLDAWDREVLKKTSMDEHNYKSPINCIYEYDYDVLQPVANFEEFFEIDFDHVPLWKVDIYGDFAFYGSDPYIKETKEYPEEYISDEKRSEVELDYLLYNSTKLEQHSTIYY